MDLLIGFNLGKTNVVPKDKLDPTKEAETKRKTTNLKEEAPAAEPKCKTMDPTEEALAAEPKSKNPFDALPKG